MKIGNKGLLKLFLVFVLTFIFCGTLSAEDVAAADQWVQTTDSDFQQGQSQNINTTTSPGDVVLTQDSTTTPGDASAPVLLADWNGNPFSSVSNPDLTVDGNSNTYWNAWIGYVAPVDASAPVLLADWNGNSFSSVSNPDLTVDGNSNTYWNAWIGYVAPKSASADVNNADASTTTDGNNGTYWQGASENASIVFDLGEVRKVSGFRETTGGFPGNPYKAYVSTDSINWSQVSSGSLASNGWGYVSFPVSDVRYIKLVVQRTDANGYGELAEFNVLVEDASIVFDLGEVRKVSGFRETTGGFPGNPYKAYVSTDGINWSQVSSGSLASNGWGYVSFPVTDARFIKLLIQRTNDLGSGELAEFNVLVEDASIVFDLGEVRKVSGFRETTGGFPGNPYKAYVSTDGINWSQVSSGLNLTQNGWSNVFFSSVMDVRYIKLLIQRTNDLGSGELAEFNVIINGYTPSGTLTSQIFDAGSNVDWGIITWNAAIPSGTSLKIETRSSSNGNTWSQWQTSTNGSEISSPNARYLQYRATLQTTDPNSTPILHELTVIYQGNRPPVLNSIGDKTVNENQNLQFTLFGSDPDGNALTYSATGLPAGASFDSATKTFSWTPTYDQSGAYPVTFTVSDGSLFASETVTITVTNVNRAPVLDSVGPKMLNEGGSLSFAVSGSDPDGGSLIYSVTALQNGATLDPETGVFSWNPTYSQAGSYPMTFTVSDGILTDSETITITVNNVNQPPVLSFIGDKTVDENSNLLFTVSGSDSDGDALTYGASGLSAGATFNGNTFSWTPSYEQAGTHTVTFTASDGVDSVSETVIINVANVNQAPVLGTIDSMTVPEVQAINFQIPGSDLDNDPLNYYSLGSWPEGALISSIGLLTWTPSYAQAGDYILDFLVDDGTITTPGTVHITVNNVNRAPVLDNIGPQSVEEGGSLSFPVSGGDPDGGSLTYTTSDLPTGATFSGNVFSWTPNFAQAGSYPVTFTVTDEGGLTNSEIVIFTVNNVNRPPVLNSIGNQQVYEGVSLSFPVSGGDPDGNSLTYSVVGQLPAGATFEGSTFSWTPSFTQAGSYSVTFKVSDGNMEDTEIITIDVGNVNRAPELGAIGSRTINEGESLSLSVIGSDDDGDALTYSTTGLPTGASFDGMTFSWTPGYDQAGSHIVTFQVSDRVSTDSETVTITVNNVNRAPVLDSIGAKAVDEGQVLDFTLSSTDPDGSNLIFSTSNLPVGAVFDPVNKRFTWTPDFDQAGTYEVTFTTTDAGGLSDSETVTFTVNNVNRAPVLDPVGPKSVNEGQVLEFTVSGSDPDSDTLTYSATGLPVDASFDPATKTFSWTPDFAQAGNYPVTFTVTDISGGTYSETVTIMVNNVDRPPVLNPIGDQDVNEGQSISFPVWGSDPDGDQLTYTATGLPAGASFVGDTFNWDSAVPGVYTVTFTATTGGLSDSKTITITVFQNTDQAPVAILDGPYTAYGGSEITFDGSASYDPNGDQLTYEWDLNGDGIFETPGMMVSKTWNDDYTGTVSLRVTDTHGLSSATSSTVTVTNTAPTATLSSSFFVKVPITMRVAGQPGNSVELQIIQEGVVIASKTILFTAGSPNEQEVTLLANIDLSKSYTGKLIFNTGTKTSGATPVWLIIDGKKTKVATFKSNPNNPSSWSQTLNIPLKGLFTLANKQITFNAQATDSGADALTFEWSFGDGTPLVVNTYSAGSTVINDSVSHTYLQPGVYQLILRVRDDEGAEVTYQMDVRVV